MVIRLDNSGVSYLVVGADVMVIMISILMYHLYTVVIGSEKDHIY